jgi:hypothetical protein
MMADEILSSSWRILEPYGCASLHVPRRRGPMTIHLSTGLQTPDRNRLWLTDIYQYP